MTNVKLLKEKIKQSGLKKGFIAEQLGISRANLTALINDKADFKASQICAICNLLNIKDDAEIKAIFFAKFGA